MKRYRNAHSWTFHKTFHSFTVIKFIIDDAFFTAFRAFSNCLILFLAYVEFIDYYLNTKCERMNKWINVHACVYAHAKRHTHTHTHIHSKIERYSLPIGTIYLIWVPFIDTAKIWFESNEMSSSYVWYQCEEQTEAENIHYHRFQVVCRTLALSLFLVLSPTDNWLRIKVDRNNETMYTITVIYTCIKENLKSDSYEKQFKLAHWSVFMVDFLSVWLKQNRENYASICV